MANSTAATGTPDPVAPGSMGDVRRSNLALVLGRIARSAHGTHLTRAQVAAATGLTKASVSSLVLDLLDAGLIREIGLNPQGERGRPGVGVELNPARAVMGMEINVDYIAAGLTDLSGTLLLQETRERDNRNSAAGPVVASLAALAAELRGAGEAQGIQVLGGGLAVPGLVEDRTGTVIMAPNLGWNSETLDLGSLLPGVPLGTTLFNEANAAALAELRYRPAGAADFVFVSGEVGVGGGLVIGSELFAGPDGHAGELGHIVVQPEGSVCSCGGTGCLETVAGQDAIFTAAGIIGDSRATGEALPESAGEPPGTSKSESLARLLAALAAGDDGAATAVARAGHYLGVAVASTARLLNISSVVLGGHFAILGEWLRPALTESLARYAPGKVPPENISLSSVGEAGALLGAAGSVVRSLVEAPHRLRP
ncbi:putative NBD/HSP70 family sugar kinase [Arthrobacter pascens]|uniref:ROK family transcriptional regulator n=1 Tax=Arthrobacter pascens TaxID=1677 RepID=UPI00279068E7|nr:ROK family transcriptional regulator [Arthrobacter pascens]MDQ0678096.1 putative NBD/HSP70 family sugar kinase [Arthrobacter pascens]